MIGNFLRFNFLGVGDIFVFFGFCVGKWVMLDYMVEEMYDEMNFIINIRKSGGFYVFYEKSEEYKRY